MDIQRADLSQTGAETDTVVVVDVLRAFTTAAAAFAAGAGRIIPVKEIGEAKTLLEEFPDALTMGEDAGIPIPGFDFSNSPTQFESINLVGKTIIQRTSNGTQGLVDSLNASNLLASSLVCASATVRLLQRIDPRSLTLVETGRHGGGYAEEDEACGDMLEKRLRGDFFDLDNIRSKARESATAQPFSDPLDFNHPYEDLEFALQIDKYEFAMQVFPEDGLPVLRRVDI